MISPDNTLSLELRLLGVPNVRLAGTDLKFAFKKILGLIAFLSLEGKTSRSKLASLFWSALDEDSARRNLRRELHRLKTKFPNLEGLIVADGEALRLSTACSTDVDSFQAAFEVADLEHCLELWCGRLLEGFELDDANGFFDWLEIKREYLERLHTKAVLDLAQRLETKGDWRRALELQLHLLETDALQERTHRQVMRLHYLLGEREAALVQFERCRNTLQTELGLAPLPETASLAEQIRNAQTLETLPVQAAVRSSALLPTLAPFVRRRAVWAQMEAAWAAAQPIFISGEPGVGKTRLMLEFAASKGTFELNDGRPGDAITPFSTASRTIQNLREKHVEVALPNWVRRELSRLVPSLTDEPPPPVGSLEERSRFFNAFAEFVLLTLHDVPTLLSDDMQFFDAASLEMGFSAVQRFAQVGGKKRSIVAFRPNELSAETQTMLESFLQTGQAVLIELEPFDETQVLEMVRGLSGASGANLFSKRLHHATGGNPFFALETIRSLFESDLLQLSDDGGWTTPFDQNTSDYTELPIPPSVREAVIRRVKKLGAASGRLLEAASLTSDGFTLETLTGATALTEWEEIEALEGAISERVLEVFGEGYRFSHDLIRSSIAESLTRERKKLLHRKLAASLEKSDGAPARIADHLEKAGLKLEAVPWRVKAAKAAAQVYANQDALEQYQKALDDGATNEDAFVIREARTQIWELLDNPGAWRRELELIDKLVTHINNPEFEDQRLLFWAYFYSGQEMFSEGLSFIHQVLKRSNLSNHRTARAWYIGSICLYGMGRIAECNTMLNSALQHGPSEPTSLAGNIHHQLCRNAAEQADLETAWKHNAASLEIFDALGDHKGLSVAWMAAGTLAGMAGDTKQSVGYFERALEQSRLIGDVYRQRGMLDNLIKAHLDLFELDAVQIRLEESRALPKEFISPIIEARLFYNQGFYQQMRGNLGESLQAFQRSFELYNLHGSPSKRIIACLSLAGFWLYIGNLFAASQVLNLGASLTNQLEFDPHRNNLTILQSQLYLAQGHARQALEYLESELSQQIIDAELQVELAALTGAIKLTFGDPLAALDAVKPIEDSPSMASRSQLLAIRIKTCSALKKTFKQDLLEVEALLESKRVQPLDALELRRALANAFGSSNQPKKALEVCKAAKKSLLEMAATLEDYPELKTSFLEKNADLLNLK